jgi:hypothetical protein
LDITANHLSDTKLANSGLNKININQHTILVILAVLFCQKEVPVNRRMFNEHSPYGVEGMTCESFPP